jgi:hypothetical protein
MYSLIPLTQVFWNDSAASSRRFWHHPNLSLRSDTKPFCQHIFMSTLLWMYMYKVHTRSLEWQQIDCGKRVSLPRSHFCVVTSRNGCGETRRGYVTFIGHSVIVANIAHGLTCSVLTASKLLHSKLTILEILPKFLIYRFEIEVLIFLNIYFLISKIKASSFKVRIIIKILLSSHEKSLSLMLSFFPHIQESCL